MDLPHSGSLNGAAELLRIETELFTLYVQGRPYHPTVETLQLHRSSSQEWVSAQLGLDCSERLGNVQIKVFSPELGGMVEWQPGSLFFLVFMRHSRMNWLSRTSARIAFLFIMRMCCCDRRLSL